MIGIIRPDGTIHKNPVHKATMPLHINSVHTPNDSSIQALGTQEDIRVLLGFSGTLFGKIPYGNELALRPDIFRFIEEIREKIATGLKANAKIGIYSGKVKNTSEDTEGIDDIFSGYLQDWTSLNPNGLSPIQTLHTWQKKKHDIITDIHTIRRELQKVASLFDFYITKESMQENCPDGLHGLKVLPNHPPMASILLDDAERGIKQARTNANDEVQRKTRAIQTIISPDLRDLLRKADPFHLARQIQANNSTLIKALEKARN